MTHEELYEAKEALRAHIDSLFNELHSLSDDAERAVMLKRIESAISAFDKATELYFKED